MGKLIPFQPERSDHIAHMDYDPDNMYLYVRFKNQSSYTFAGVPAHVFAHMTQAQSAGKFFHQVIKRHYRMVEKAEANGITTKWLPKKGV